MKKVISVIMADASTGVILGSSRKVCDLNDYNLFNNWLINWKDSFIRGCSKRNDLVLQITCSVVKEELDLPF